MQGQEYGLNCMGEMSLLGKIGKDVLRLKEDLGMGEGAYLNAIKGQVIL